MSDAKAWVWFEAGDLVRTEMARTAGGAEVVALTLPSPDGHVRLCFGPPLARRLAGVLGEYARAVEEASR